VTSPMAASPVLASPVLASRARELNRRPVRGGGGPSRRPRSSG
jgi:hypothetical protein